MPDGPVLYLAIEGVLIPLSASRSRAGADALKVGGTHVQRLECLLDEVDAKVIVNSSLVQSQGYSATLGTLSDGIRLRTVGATMPGNRVLGNRMRKSANRRAWLEDDIRRRQAGRVAIIDHDFRYVPVQLRHLTLIANGGLGSVSEDDWMKLRELLMQRNSH